jgi:predicted PP-loop superfamily ATPase
MFMKVSRYLKLSVTPLEKTLVGLTRNAQNSKHQEKSYLCILNIKNWNINSKTLEGKFEFCNQHHSLIKGSLDDSVDKNIIKIIKIVNIWLNSITIFI